MKILGLSPLAVGAGGVALLTILACATWQRFHPVPLDSQAALLGPYPQMKLGPISDKEQALAIASWNMRANVIASLLAPTSIDYARVLAAQGKFVAGTQADCAAWLDVSGLPDLQVEAIEPGTGAVEVSVRFTDRAVPAAQERLCVVRLQGVISQDKPVAMANKS